MGGKPITGARKAEIVAYYHATNGATVASVAAHFDLHPSSVSKFLRLLRPPIDKMEHLEWRPVPGFIRYEVSELGHLRTRCQLRTRPKHYPLKGTRGQFGYTYYKVTWADGIKRAQTAHRLVAFAFHGLPPKGRDQVRHLDGNGSNNDYRNLCWGSHRENMRDSARHGSKKGERNGRAKVTDEIVRQMRAEYQGRFGDQTRIGRKYGLGQSATRQILTREHWGHVNA